MSVVASFYWFYINNLNLPYLQPQCLSLKDFFKIAAVCVVKFKQALAAIKLNC